VAQLARGRQCPVHHYPSTGLHSSRDAYYSACLERGKQVRSGKFEDQTLLVHHAGPS
jgi:hypothetical protein